MMDSGMYSKQYFINRLIVGYGGRIAEELIFGHENITTGASNDIVQNTKLAKAIVSKYGFTSAIGAIELDENNENVEKEVTILLKDTYEKARKLLSENMEGFQKLIDLLIEKETLNKDDIDVFSKSINV